MSPILELQLAGASAGGAAIGSFLSVLVARIPKILLDAQSNTSTARAILSGISWPGSHCRECQADVSWRDNIPVWSYLWLGGKCRDCGTAYGRRYFVLECCSALAAAICVWVFGWTGEAALCFALFASLIALTAIDLKHQLLPDVLVVPLLPLGLLFHAWYRDGLVSALEGMAAGYLVMWGIGAAYRLSTGRVGMGFGDVKMATALGAWLGATAVPFFLIGAFATGVLATLPLLALGRLNAKLAVPFGPFLCLSAAIFIILPSAASWTQSLLFNL